MKLVRERYSPIKWNVFFPKMNLVMTLAALSMAGVPLLNGFLSKEMFFDSLVSAIELQQFGLTLTIIVVAIGGIASIFYFLLCMQFTCLKKLIGENLTKRKCRRNIFMNLGCSVYLQ